MKTLTLTALLALLAISGCATLPEAHRKWSVGQVGCPENEIHVSDDVASQGVHTWAAECRGKRFQCGTSGGGIGNFQTSCKEEVRASK